MQLLPISDINEKEGLIGEEENFLRVGDVATLDQIVVKEQVWYLHESLMHPILSVEEGVRMASLNKPGEKGGRSRDSETIGWTHLILVTHENDLLCV